MDPRPMPAPESPTDARPAPEPEVPVDPVPAPAPRSPLDPLPSPAAEEAVLRVPPSNAPSLAGLATGARSMAPLALLVSSEEHPLTGSLLGAAAVGEFIADKVAPLPPRTDPGPLVGRAVLGGVAGALLARRRGDSTAGGVLAGSAAAVAGAWAFTRLRAWLTERGVPDVAVALAEDLAVVGLIDRARGGG